MNEKTMSGNGKVVGRAYGDMGFPVRSVTRYYDNGRILTMIRSIDKADFKQGWKSKAGRDYEEYTEDFFSKRAFGVFRRDCKSLDKAYRCVCVS